MTAAASTAAAAAAAAESTTPLPRMLLGSQGLEVSVQGLGCMGMSFFYGQPKPDSDMIAVIHHAIAAGVTLFDTSDAYGPHTNEILLGKALRDGFREKVKIATKFGIRFEDGERVIQGDPDYVRSCCEGSLERLGVDCIDLYYLHRIDPTVPIELTILALFGRALADQKAADQPQPLKFDCLVTQLLFIFFLKYFVLAAAVIGRIFRRWTTIEEGRP